MPALISIVAPLFNEEENVAYFVEEVTKVFGKLKYNYEIILVDDGSQDKSLKVVKKIAEKNTKIKYITFSRNFGHQAAVKAGLDHALGDAVISMDSDLQHPPELIPVLIEKWEEGYQVVYTVRDDEKTPFFKKITAKLFYWLINKLSSVEIEAGAADFRLLDSQVVNELKKLNESSLFLRGLVKWCGFKQYAINYRPHKRRSGESKYSLRKMVRLALDGITSFSVVPLQLSTFLGFAFSSFAAIYAIYALIVFALGYRVISGWASVIVSVLFLGGIQLLILGLVGEYLGKTFLEVKKRPIYIIGETNLK
jgi:dolichol-phosphate mannosyltransferase